MYNISRNIVKSKKAKQDFQFTQVNIFGGEVIGFGFVLGNFFFFLVSFLNIVAF